MIKITKLTFKTKYKFKKSDAEKLRGYFASLYPEKDFIHNHKNENEYYYRMPLIHYKIINGELSIIGLNDTGDFLLKEFIKHENIIINDKKHEIEGCEITQKNEEFYVDNKLHKYKFITMWLPISSNNLDAYESKKLDLNTLLQNNILSNFKGLQITVKDRIMVHGEYEEKNIKLKDKVMIGFYGEFISNVKLPELIGIGRRKSIGFGDIKTIL